jgi:hypothetical protein
VRKTDHHKQGLPGIITLKNGDKYSGVLSGTSLDPSELRYVFKMVKKLLPASNAQTNGASQSSDDYVGSGDYHVMSFDMSDVADFNVNNVVLDKSQLKGPNGKCQNPKLIRMPRLTKKALLASALTPTFLASSSSASATSRNGNRPR